VPKACQGTVSPKNKATTKQLPAFIETNILRREISSTTLGRVSTYELEVVEVYHLHARSMQKQPQENTVEDCYIISTYVKYLSTP
jgi:hypothetical protein